jgi:hypothetical protein
MAGKPGLFSFIGAGLSSQALNTFPSNDFLYGSQKTDEKRHRHSSPSLGGLQTTKR